MLGELFDEQTRATSTVTELRPGFDLDDRGVSIHVYDTASMTERLRFDCFDENPHYHYIKPPGGGIVVAYDAAANGPMRAWVSALFRSGRLFSMLGLR